MQSIRRVGDPPIHGPKNCNHICANLFATGLLPENSRLSQNFQTKIIQQLSKAIINHNKESTKQKRVCIHYLTNNIAWSSAGSVTKAGPSSIILGVTSSTLVILYLSRHCVQNCWENTAKICCLVHRLSGLHSLPGPDRLSGLQAAWYTGMYWLLLPGPSGCLGLQVA